MGQREIPKDRKEENFVLKWVTGIVNGMPERILYIFVCVKLEELALKVIIHALLICRFFFLLVFFQLNDELKKMDEQLKKGKRDRIELSFLKARYSYSHHS